MKFLLDQDVYAPTARFLNGLGHEAVPVAKIGLSQTEDSDLLKTAREQDRILISRDRDFGGLVFVQDLGAGVIYLRMLPSTQNVVHQELERVLRHQGMLFRFVHSLAGQEEIGLTLVSAWEGACEDADGSVVGRLPQAVFLWLGSCQKLSPSVTRLPLHWNLAADDDGNQHRPFSRKHESGWRFSPAAKFFVNYACAQR